MTKWFDTNYHYIVPEFAASTSFTLDASRLLAQLAEAQAAGVRAKPVIVGPVTYLALGKAKDGSDKLALFDRLLPVYVELREALANAGRPSQFTPPMTRPPPAGCSVLRGLPGAAVALCIIGGFLAPLGRVPPVRRRWHSTAAGEVFSA